MLSLLPTKFEHFQSFHTDDIYKLQQLLSN